MAELTVKEKLVTGVPLSEEEKASHVESLPRLEREAAAIAAARERKEEESKAYISGEKKPTTRLERYAAETAEKQELIRQKEAGEITPEEYRAITGILGPQGSWYYQDYEHGEVQKAIESGKELVAILGREKVLQAQAGVIAAERHEGLYPTGEKDVELLEAWERLTPGVKEELEKGVQEESYLREQSAVLTKFRMAGVEARRAVLPEVRVAIYDIIKGTTLPVIYEVDKVRYDMDKISASPTLSAKFEKEVKGGVDILAEYRSCTAANAVIESALASLEDYKVPEGGYYGGLALYGGVSEDAILAALGPEGLEQAKAEADVLSKRAAAEKEIAPYYQKAIPGVSEAGYSVYNIFKFGTPAQIAAAKLLLPPGVFSEAMLATTTEAGYGAQELTKWTGKVMTTEEYQKASTVLAAPTTAEIAESMNLRQLLGTAVNVSATELAGEYMKILRSDLPLMTKARLLRGGYGPGPGEEVRTPYEVLTSPEMQLVGAGLFAAGGPMLATRLPSWLAKAVHQTLRWGAISVATTGAGAMIAGAVTKPKVVNVAAYAVNVSKVGTAESQVPAKYVEVGSKIKWAELVEDYGETRATRMLAQAGLKPTIERGVWEQLPPETQQYYTPTERTALAYQGGILGVYGRGVEYLQVPATYLATREGLAKWPARLAGGMYQYFVPHTMVAQLYPEKGALAAITLVPHFGATWGYTGLTWKEQPWYGKALGITFGAMPFIAGPISSAFGKVSAKVPALGAVGTFGKVVTAPIRGVSSVLGLELWAPWRFAYEAGRLVPKIGPLWYSKGWLGLKLSYEEQVRQWSQRSIFGGETAETWEAKHKLWPVKEEQPAVTEFRTIELTEAELMEAMKGPKYGTTTTAQEATVTQLATKQAAALESAKAQLVEAGYKGSVQIGEEGFYQYFPPEQPALVQTVEMPTIMRVFEQFMSSMPRVATVAAYTAPIVGAAVFPVMALTTFTTPTTVEQSITAVDQMLEQGQITSVQRDQLVQQLRQVEYQVQQLQLTEQQEQQQIQQTVRSVLTEEQQQQLQWLQEEQQQTVRQTVQQQQENIQQVIQQQEQQQVQEVQQIQQQVLQTQQISQLQLFPQQPLTPITPPCVTPIIPFLEEFGASLGGAGSGAGGIGGLLRGGGWKMPELILFMPEPFGTGKMRITLAKKRVRKYGAKGYTVKSPIYELAVRSMRV